MVLGNSASHNMTAALGINGLIDVPFIFGYDHFVFSPKLWQINSGR